MESRYLGEIMLDHAHSMQGAVQYEGARLPVRFELAHPAKATDATIEDIDMVLDQIALLDELGQHTVKSKLGEARSSALQFYSAWERRHPFGEASVEAFIAALRPVHIDIQPDGGREQPIRVTLKYGLADSPVTSTLDVRYLEPTGPELAPVPSGGYR